MNLLKKTASLLVFAAAMLVSCNKLSDDSTTTGGVGVIIPDLVASFDKNVIRTNGEVATLKAYYKGQDVTNEATFFQVVGGKPNRNPSGNTFSSSTAGDFLFRVGYKTSTSKDVTISVVDKELPVSAEDPAPSNTSFVHRTFLNQHTGANCGYCPGMTKLLRETLVGDTKDKVVLAAIRGFGGGEPGFAMIPNPSSGYPFLHIDYAVYPEKSYNTSVSTLRSMIDARVADDAVAGISANPVYYSDTKQIIVRVQVKAHVQNEYNVGLWLLQDNYYAEQKDELGIADKTYNHHDNCVRIANSEYLGAHVGYPLGMIASGQTAEWVYVFDLKDAIEKSKTQGGWWESFSEEKLNDLHFAAFVTTHQGNLYTVVNAIDFPYNKETKYDYK